VDLAEVSRLERGRRGRENLTVPHALQPFLWVCDGVNKFADYCGDLVVRHNAHAWLQLLCAMTAMTGIICSAMQVKAKVGFFTLFERCDPHRTSSGILLGMSSIALAAFTCSIEVPIIVAITGFWAYAIMPVASRYGAVPPPSTHHRSNLPAQ